MDKSQVKKILLITLSNLGDIVLTTPVLEKLCDEFPGSSIDVVTSPTGKEFFKTHPVLRRSIIYKKGWSLRERLEHFLELRREKYDLVVDLKNTLVPYLLKAKFRTGFCGPFTAGRHKKEEHLAKLAALGLDAFSDNRFFVPVSEEDKHLADSILPQESGEKAVVMNPGAKSHLKRWGASNFAALADRLTGELGCTVLICGNEDDRDVVEEVMSLVKGQARNLCCKTSIGVLSEIMRRSALVVTNDSAPLHLASAVNAPTVAIFGPSSELKYGPLAGKSRAIKPDISCRPCERALCAIGPDEGCIMRVTVEQVFDAAKELLGGV
jgi:heptosyltransferase-2